ncbi:MAG: aminotransferase class V-fold PLP-dependent enzyme [Anaerolineales bacterium]|nr:aminotransferase class V-fold PLP-dependent enzyme [Anaerolineales bacterium]
MVRSQFGEDAVCYAEPFLAFNQAQFLAEYPPYGETQRLDELRAAEYGRLDRLGHVYLDYTGGGLYAESQLRRHQALLLENVFGNPHSNNPSSLAMARLVEEARAYVLAFFHADPAEYTVVFTANASGALKLVGESYPFTADSHYVIAYDNHNSVNGIREFARAKGAAVTYVPTVAPELRLDQERFEQALAAGQPGANRLLAYPAQSNFSGVQHPLRWVEEATAGGWDVLLDCAAYVPTNTLDLRIVKPSFIPISFYKMFGYPTGVGALIARRDSLAKLQRPWFAGGTISIASVQGPGWHYLLQGEAGFEDGTVNYLNLPAVEIGLRHLQAIGMETIHARVNSLAGWLLTQLDGLRHTNGGPVVKLFGPRGLEARGGTIAFYFVDPEGEQYDVRRVETMAGEELISLRTGCFCNPGDGEIAHDIRPEEMAGCFAGRTSPCSYTEFFQRLHDSSGKTPSTIRVSLGIASNFEDVHRFMAFAEGLRDLKASALDTLPVGKRHMKPAPDTA